MVNHSNSAESDQQFMIGFYEQYKSFLSHTARKFAQSQHDCEDIIQDTLIRLMRNIPTLRRLSKNQTAAYLFLTVRSAYTDRMKSPQERISFAAGDISQVPDDSTPFAYDAKWDAEILRRGLAPRDWTLLEYKYILGYPDEDIAQMLGCAPDSVRTLLRRARSRAKAILDSGNRKEGEE